MSINELEKLLLSVVSRDETIAEQLENDFAYLEKDSFVERIAQAIEEKQFEEEVFLGIDSNNWIQSGNLLEIPNIYDMVTQAVLASPGTPQNTITQLLDRHPDWLDNGWWCAQRLLQNSSISGDLVEKCVSALIDMEEYELLELALEHPNISDETRSEISTLDS